MRSAWLSWIYILDCVQIHTGQDKVDWKILGDLQLPAALVRCVSNSVARREHYTQQKLTFSALHCLSVIT